MKTIYINTRGHSSKSKIYVNIFHGYELCAQYLFMDFVNIFLLQFSAFLINWLNME